MATDSETCIGNCQDGWLSPRMKFILSTTAGVAADLILGTGEFAEELGHVEGVYLTPYIPSEQLPDGPSAAAAAAWVEGFSAVCGTVGRMLEAGQVPTADALLLELEVLGLPKPTGEGGGVGAPAVFLEYTEIEWALEAVVRQAREEWESGEFEETYGADERWKFKELPKCAEHDLDWEMALENLAG
ncbi:hypothetical protein LshimejAT787_1700400 [Lyophyllum shimeji]|uniref:Uncharacterized protein n=1 Tax=Lyophyllum shimeji TaxID=47721 RepID=A0A9P3PYK7_LYOSH|nr:hypothetical protein LshimejAT787_1700400 [Lyophyllum shimeji]